MQSRYFELKFAILPHSFFSAFMRVNLDSGLGTVRNSTQCERENNLIETLPQLEARDTQAARGQL
jgi:hypothetical protein